MHIAYRAYFVSVPHFALCECYNTVIVSSRPRDAAKLLYNLCVTLKALVLQSDVVYFQAMLRYKGLLSIYVVPNGF